MPRKHDLDEALVRALRETVRPLVTRLLGHGVPFGRVEAALRALFVDVAESELAAAGRVLTDSSVASLSGLSRREVHRIRTAPPGAPAGAAFNRNLAANVITLWLRDQRAIDARGRPLPIPYRAKRGPSFVSFARATTLDMRPQALLDTLVSTGVAEIRPGRQVALVADAFVPRRGAGAKVAALVEDPAELVDTILRNVFEEDPAPLLQRKAAYDNVSAEALPRIRADIRREGERFIQRVSRLLARHDRDVNRDAPGGPRGYAGLGVYYFEGSGARRSARKPRRKEPS